MKTLNEFVNNYICEARKFSNFNDEELNTMKAELEQLKKQYNEILKGNKVEVLTPNAIELGKKYFVVFENPFNNDRLYSKNAEKAVAPEENDTIITLGVGDKFGNVHLPLEWEGKNTVLNSKDGKNWTITRKDAKGLYKVNVRKGKRGESDWLFVDEKESRGVWNCPIRRVLALIDVEEAMPALVKKVQAKIEKEAEKKKVKELQDAENKKWWDKVDTYKDLGIANAWKSGNEPKEFIEASNDPENEWIEVMLNKSGTYKMMVSDKHKIKFTVDSSD